MLEAGHGSGRACRKGPTTSSPAGEGVTFPAAAAPWGPSFHQRPFQATNVVSRDQNFSLGPPAPGLPSPARAL